MVTQENFFTNTRAVFKACKMPKRTPDFISPSGSKYWYEDSFVIRFSDHWTEYFCKGVNMDLLEQRRGSIKKIGEIFRKNFYGCGNIASCFWTLYVPKNVDPREATCGKCYFSSFKVK